MIEDEDVDVDGLWRMEEIECGVVVGDESAKFSSHGGRVVLLAISDLGFCAHDEATSFGASWVVG
jgi:hypothetical protein